MNIAAKQTSSLGEIVLGGLITFFVLTAFLIFSRPQVQLEYNRNSNTVTFNHWPDPSVTAGGQLLIKHLEEEWKRWVERSPNEQITNPPFSLTLKHQAVGSYIHWTNKVASHWKPLFILSLLSFIFTTFLLIKKKIQWGKGVIRFINLAGFITYGGFLVLAPSINGFWTFSKVLGGLWEAVLIVLIWIQYQSTAHDKDRKLIYGPQFSPPSTKKTTAIQVGLFEPTVLPQTAQWACPQDQVEVELHGEKLSRGITILGDMGSGKTRLMMVLHDAIRKRFPRIPILIHDPKGEWYSTYFEPKTDLIFAPHYKSSSAWTLWRDLKNNPELQYEIIATAVYAHPSNGDTFWLDKAINLIKGAFLKDSLEEARDYLVDLKEKNSDDKFFSSVLGTATLGLLDIVKIELMSQKGDNQPKTIDNYLNLPGRIFLLNNPACASEQKGAFSLFLSMFLLRALSLPDVKNGELRAVAFIDEALTFSLPPDVERRIYTQCRSKGICLIAGGHRIPNERKREEGEWKSAEYMFGMKVNDLDTQSILSKKSGQIQYEMTTKSKTSGKEHSSETEGSHVQRHDVIPSEHFGRLGKREFILFHSKGITPGKTKEIWKEQRQGNVPVYDPRSEVTEFMTRLD